MYGPQNRDWLDHLSHQTITDEEAAAVVATVADWISAYGTRHARTADAKRAATRLGERDRRFAAGAVLIDFLAVAVLVSALLSRTADRGVANFARLGGGLGAVVFLLLPLAAPVAAGALAWRAERRAARARIRAHAHRHLFICSAAAASWIVTVLCGVLAS